MMPLKNYFYFTIMLLASNLYAQQMPIDFEDGSAQFITFGGTAFSIVPEPGNTSNSVGRVVNSGGAAFEGMYLDLLRDVDFSQNKLVGLRIKPQDNNAHTVLLKFEMGTGSAVEVPRNIPSGNANTWVPLSFDFANAVVSGSAATINATGQYSRITFFVDGGQNISGTYLIDDIDDGTTATSPIDVVYSDLVWSDEFNATGTNNPINSANWFHQTQLPMPGGWFNNEVQHYTNRTENSYVENGFLHIKAKRETYRDQNLTRQFTSARLNSKFAFTYGRVDVRAKLPFGDGTWPAIWTLGVNVNEPGNYWRPFQSNLVNWPACGEIDIMEHGLGATNHVSAALHTPCAGCFGNTMNFRSRTLQDVANTFHIYSMNWSPDRIVFLVDDVPFYTYRPDPKNAGNWPFDSDQYMLLNVAMGGFAGAVDPSFRESEMVIDYVRIFQNTASINDDFQTSLRVYPNPASDRVTISSNAPIDGVVIHDLLGNRIEREWNPTTGTIELSGLSSGIYLFKINSGSASVTRKVVVR